MGDARNVEWNGVSPGSRDSPSPHYHAPVPVSAVTGALQRPRQMALTTRDSKAFTQRYLAGGHATGFVR